FPGARRIAKEAALTERAVRKAIKRLDDSGVLTIEGRGGRGAHNTNTYRIPVPPRRNNQSNTDSREQGSRPGATARKSSLPWPGRIRIVAKDARVCERAWRLRSRPGV